MIAGIDVGGTNTDAVLTVAGKLVRKAKVPTGHLLSCIMEVLDRLCPCEGDRNALKRVVLSTTLSTNAIVQDSIRKAGMIVSAGPGIDPRHYDTGGYYQVVAGALDHRGREIEKLDREGVMDALDSLKARGIGLVGLVSKFSTRNALHERQMMECAGDSFLFLSPGHLLSGSLNFPRRIASTFLNASVHPLQYDFVTAVTEAMKEKGISAPLYILKADGGTMTIDESVNLPVYTICSGPAASIMGLMALVEEKDYIGLDIGGTTTDISIFWNGVPLFLPKGITIGSYQTLVRGLLTRSIGVGGDSEITAGPSGFSVGPLRRGPAMALGGSVPTLTDALNVAGSAKVGDLAKSGEGIGTLAAHAGLAPEECASAIARQAALQIHSAVRDLLESVNSRPVYTIREMLRGHVIAPSSIAVVGGPAPAMAPWLQQQCGLPALTPGHHEVANAVGAALSRVTAELTVLADTEQGRLVAVEEDYEQAIGGGFSLHDAHGVAHALLDRRMAEMGGDPGGYSIDTVEEQQFPMVRGFYRVGKNMRVRVQVMPGLTGTLKGGN